MRSCVSCSTCRFNRDASSSLSRRLDQMFTVLFPPAFEYEIRQSVLTKIFSLKHSKIAAEPLLGSVEHDDPGDLIEKIRRKIRDGSQGHPHDDIAALHVDGTRAVNAVALNSPVEVVISFFLLGEHGVKVSTQGDALVRASFAHHDNMPAQWRTFIWSAIHSRGAFHFKTHRLEHLDHDITDLINTLGVVGK